MRGRVSSCSVDVASDGLSRCDVVRDVCRWITDSVSQLQIDQLEDAALRPCEGVYAAAISGTAGAAYKCVLIFYGWTITHVSFESGRSNKCAARLAPSMWPFVVAMHLMTVMLTARRSDTWPWGAYGPEVEAAPARSPFGRARVQSKSPSKPAAKRGRGAIATAPPNRGRGRGRKRGAGSLAAIAEERAFPRQKRLRGPVFDGSAEADGDVSERSSEEGGQLVRIDEVMSANSDQGDDSLSDDGADKGGGAAAPARKGRRQRRSVARMAHTIQEDDDDGCDLTEEGNQGRLRSSGNALDDGPETVSEQPASQSVAAVKKGSLLDRLLSQPGPSSQPTPSWSVTQSLPAISQVSEEAPGSPAHSPHASLAASAQPAPRGTAQDTGPGCQAAQAVGPAIAVTASDIGVLLAPPAGGRMSLKEKYAELKAMRARQADV